MIHSDLGTREKERDCEREKKRLAGQIFDHLGWLFKVDTRRRSREERYGVCRLNCGQCASFYIGQTGRKLKIRVGEHRTACNSGKPQDSAMEAHCLNTGHDIQLISANLLHNCTKCCLLNKLEEAETIVVKSREDSTLLNDLTATYVSSFIRYYYNWELKFITCREII